MTILAEVLPSYEDAFSTVAELQHCISSCRLDGERLPGLYAEIVRAAEDRNLGETHELRALVSRLRRRDPRDRWRELPAEDAGAMSASCEMLRFRLFAAAFGGRSDSVEEMLCESMVPRVVTRCPSGIVYAVLQNKMVVLLPELESKTQCTAIADELLRLYESESSRPLDWVLDFSAVTQLPSILFLGLLKALQRDLKQRGMLFTIAWLRADTFSSEAFREDVCKSLGLRMVGGFLFSEQRKR